MWLAASASCRTLTGAWIETIRRVMPRRGQLYAFLEKNAKTGHAAYVVCPLIETADQTDVRSAFDTYMELSQAVGNHVRTALLHGKLPAKEKQEIMEAFAAGQIDILVATTVIEVGVDVRRANVMVVESAERFGLATLHQLRGRVGRGDEDSWCFLVTDHEKDAKRLHTLAESNDGFHIAQCDLEQRGPGEFLGVRQNGIADLYMRSLMKDASILDEAREAYENSEPMQRAMLDMAAHLRFEKREDAPTPCTSSNM